MEEILNCPVCHVQIRPTDFFCYNCGKNVREKPPSTSVARQALLYAGSILLPPMGFIWGFRYIRQSDASTKIVGIIAMILTTISLIITTIYAINLVNNVNDQVNKQMQSIQGF